MQSLFKQHFKRMSPKAQQCVSSFWAAGHVALTPASVLAPSPLLWQNIRPTGNSRKKECIRLMAQGGCKGMMVRGAEKRETEKPHFQSLRGSRAKVINLQGHPLSSIMLPKTTWKPSVEIPAPLGDTARSKHCRTLLFPWVQLVDFIL